VQKIQDYLRIWAKRGDPAKYAILLEHRYSQAGLSLVGLKGKDKAWADVLRAAIAGMPENNRFKIALGIVEISESGSASQCGYEADYEMDDDDNVERTVDIKHVMNLDGSPGSLISDDLEDDEVLPKGSFEDISWDDEKIEEATGNAGAEMERWYKAAVIFIWPNPKSKKKKTTESQDDVPNTTKKTRTDVQ